MDLSRRSDLPEVMNDPATPPEVLARCLADLATVNRLTLTHRPTLRFLARATRDWPRGTPVSVLDVAYGQGDLLRAVHRWALRAGLVPVLAGLDLDPRSAGIAAAATPADMTIAWQTGDVFDHVPNPPPDFIVSSQFAHHLNDAQILAFLRWMDLHARRGWFISDLHRHALPYYGFRLLARMMRWHRIIREDGTISIARAFRPGEWRALLTEAGVTQARVRWHMPFRLCVARLR
ncbi:Methyltransferase domain-containing protein [Rhodovastum atsumiense]|uniref:Methyltransferase domain-containing protein n=1 Tax=Rhodovastum atsumiense TaxID=504468 RepID=A0A5M6IVY8_9PROT|nr:methyltransferase domain-containing protein [Rhodovastum atsumiense]KAA5612490.1 methyltransferase domain-containing protein [Rhodovastum atsumiense]CAH2600410.1 Methyltransferase domain-containing protein [Rhodovastum atsumiense]